MNVLAAILTAVLTASPYSIHVGDLDRTFEVHRPEGTQGRKLPAVLVYHGHGGSAQKMIDGTGMNAVADRHKFLAVYPEGVRSSWNDGRPGVTPANRQGVDDVAFTSALIDELIDKHGADPERIFLAGASNGGMMTQRLACDLAGKVAGVATVIGQLSVYSKPSCSPSRPVPMLLINGTADPVVPYNGGEIATQGPNSAVLSTQATIGFWRERNGCRGPVVTRPLPDKADDGTTTTVTTSPCKNPVTLYTVKGGGHTWPGALTQTNPESVVGLTSKDFSASEAIWTFFSRIGRH